MANYSGQRGLPDNIQNGHIFDGDNFSQNTPHTKIFEGVTGLTFRNCNLVNCDVPEDAIVEKCNHRQISRCSHLHPELPIDQCVSNCSHVIDFDVLQINGVTIETIYHYEDKVL